MPEQALVEKKSQPALSHRERYDIFRSNRIVSIFFPLAMLGLIILIFGIATGGRFFTKNVMVGILNQALIVGTMATGIAFIYTTGNLDISVGNVMILASIIGAMVFNATGSVFLMIIVCVIISALLMLFNCTLSAVFNIRTAVAAIVMTRIYGAISSKILGASTLKVDYAVCRALENGGFRYISFAIYFLAAFAIYHMTKVGRANRLIGGNRNTALQTGIPPIKYQYISFLMAGLGVGLAATYTIIRTGSISPDSGGAMGTDVMLATVLGGMSIFGGAKSNSYAGIVGALTVVALNKGLLMIGVSNTLIQGIRGIVFLLLVFMNSEKQSTLPSRQQF